MYCSSLFFDLYLLAFPLLQVENNFQQDVAFFVLDVPDVFHKSFAACLITFHFPRIYSSGTSYRAFSLLSCNTNQPVKLTLLHQSGEAKINCDQPGVYKLWAQCPYAHKCHSGSCNSTMRKVNRLMDDTLVSCRVGLYLCAL